MSKKSSILTGAGVAGVIALGLLGGCESNVGPEEKPDPSKPGTTVTDPVDTSKTTVDTTKTKPDTTATKPDTTQSKPLCQVYVGSARIDGTNDRVAESLGWFTLHSLDGTWKPTTKTGKTAIRLQIDGGFSEWTTESQDGVCSGRFGIDIPSGNIIYNLDGSKGCRPVPETEQEI